MGKTMDQIADDLFPDLSEDERYALARKCEVFENGYITEHGGRLFDGVSETLNSLKKAGVPMSVVSNCQEGYVKAFLDSMDMWQYFADYEEWGRSGLLKAGNIRLVMERGGADRAVYVGDIQKDADASHEAGIPCIWAAYGFGEISDAEGKIESFAELPEVLKAMGCL
jgi:phosphoglycolate phosphatase